MQIPLPLWGMIRDKIPLKFDVPSQKQRKNVIFKVNSGAFFLPMAPTQSQTPYMYLCKKIPLEGMYEVGLGTREDGDVI